MADAAYKTGRHKGNPFKPNPRIHADPKSRRHHPITQASQFCIRKWKDGKIRCKNYRRCEGCFPAFKLFEEKA